MVILMSIGMPACACVFGVYVFSTYCVCVCVCVLVSVQAVVQTVNQQLPACV
jgi:hypothetical protein